MLAWFSRPARMSEEEIDWRATEAEDMRMKIVVDALRDMPLERDPEGAGKGFPLWV